VEPKSPLDVFQGARELNPEQFRRSRHVILKPPFKAAFHPGRSFLFERCLNGMSLTRVAAFKFTRGSVTIKFRKHDGIVRRGRDRKRPGRCLCGERQVGRPARGEELMSTITAGTAPRTFREVWLISAGHMMTHWYPATFYLLLPLIGNDLGLSFSQIGSILTCQYVAGAVSNLPGGMVVDVVGRKGLLMAVALSWIGLPYFVMGFSHSYWMLLVCAALVGIGNNLWHPTAIPLLAQNHPQRSGLVVSIHAMGGHLGDAVAPLVVGAMLTVFSWRDVVIMNVMPGVIASVLLLVLLGRAGGMDMGHDKEAAKARKAAPSLEAVLSLFANRTVVTLSLGSAMRAMTAMTLLTFLPVFLANEMGYPPSWIGGLLFALQAAGFVAAPISGHLSDQMGRRNIIMASMAMSAVVLLFMGLAGRSPAFALFVAGLGFFLFATRSVLQAWLLEATPKHLGGTSIGMLFGAQAVGAAIGPLVGGVIADHYGITATFYFLAVTIVVANLFILITPAEPCRQAPDL
jgi:MFS transporter, FSR family, fosmidomycin resistance protein